MHDALGAHRSWPKKGGEQARHSESLKVAAELGSGHGVWRIWLEAWGFLPLLSRE